MPLIYRVEFIESDYKRILKLIETDEHNRIKSRERMRLVTNNSRGIYKQKINAVVVDTYMKEDPKFGTKNVQDELNEDTKEHTISNDID